MESEPTQDAGALSSIAVVKPEEFTMTIQGGMLEALGINMYTTLGKCLVEFVANAYDAESPRVDIAIPVGEIEKARDQVRRAARASALAEAQAAGGRAPSSRGRILLLALPEDIKVTIRDAGNGMTPQQVQNVFLPINRKRRIGNDGQETNLKTENGLRYAMGRKGLGKLAGFGAAGVVRVETKRRGQDFATSFCMRYDKLVAEPNLSEVVLPATYIPGKEVQESYTLIELSALKCDAVRNNVDSIKSTLSEAFFGILPADFEIKVNEEVVVAETPKYEFTFPSGPRVDAEGFATVRLDIDDMPEPLEYRYSVRFREKGAHLPAAKRGARIYCNNRLAAGPTLLDLPTGMHNFHAQSYMECIVIADELDRFGVDIINTNRTHLRQDSQLVEKLLSTVTESMMEGIKAHSKFRNARAEQDIQDNPEARMLDRVAQQLPPRSRGPIKKLLTTLAARHGVDSTEFKEVAPLVINAANASEVLIKLIEVGANPESIEKVAGHLRDLAEIERLDALKLYRGRRNGINALKKLELEGEENWKKKASETQLHALFKSDPWLIRPEFTRPIVSDEDLSKLASKLARQIGVDSFTPMQKSGKDDLTRPDLVFVMADSAMPSEVVIVELKSPTLPLELEHLTQLERYMRKVEQFIEIELSGRFCAVRGILIGALPDSTTTAEGSLDLLHKMKKAGIREPWEVVGIRSLIERALQIHQAAIDTLEEELKEDDEEEEAQDSQSAGDTSNSPYAEGGVEAT